MAMAIAIGACALWYVGAAAQAPAELILEIDDHVAADDGNPRTMARMHEVKILMYIYSKSDGMIRRFVAATPGR